MLVADDASFPHERGDGRGQVRKFLQARAAGRGLNQFAAFPEPLNPFHRPIEHAGHLGGDDPFG